MTTDTENGNSDQGNLAAGGAEAIRGQTGRTASGCKLVPIEPTPEMLDAGEAEWCRHNHGAPYDSEIPAIYRALIAAAPSADKAEPASTERGRASDAQVTEWAARYDLGGNLSEWRDIFEDAQTLIAAAPPTALLREAMEALEMAQTGLAWYRDAMPDADSPADDEAAEQIDAALAKLRETLGEQG